MAAGQLPALGGAPSEPPEHRSVPVHGSTNPLHVALAFVDRINDHDVDGICGLMTDGHVFVDALGERFEGREAMCSGWRQFLRLFPGYSITVADVTAGQGTVGVFGTASGSYHAAPGDTWAVRAAWKAVIADGLIDEWSVYCDTGWAKRTR